MHNRFSGEGSRWALVTGASSGIGFAIASRLADAGYNLLIVSLQEERIVEAERKLSAIHNTIRVESIAADLAQPEAASWLYEECRRRNLQIDILVNDAGMFIYNDLIDTDRERVRRLLTLHILTLTELCRLFGADMAERGRGGIINLSSYSVWMPFAGLGLYCASKAYVKSFSVCFAREMKAHGVTVTAISPAGVATDLYGLSKRLQRFGVGCGVLLTPERVARRAYRALCHGRKHVVPGWYNRIFIPFLRFMPDCVLRVVHSGTERFMK